MKRPNPALVLLGLSCFLLLAVALVGCESATFQTAGAPRAQAYNDVPAPPLHSEMRAPVEGGTRSPSEIEKMTAWYPVPRYDERSTKLTEADLKDLPPWYLSDPNVEVWVIERRDVPRIFVADDSPRSGAMMATLPSDTRQVPLPLAHTDVKAAISGYIATVDVTQQFVNPYTEKIEAVYLFPLPQDSAVTDFVMTVGARKIRGIIRERGEAAKIYAEAKRQGYVASLLTQERPNVFTQKVANIEPGREIDVNIRYFQTLAYADGWFAFEFPMVVGPRFNPPASRFGVGAAARGSAGVTGQTTEVQYLRPGERSGHDISLSVRVDAGVPIEEMSSPTHVVTTKQESSSVATVALNSLDTIPNKDFVLRYRLAGATMKSALMVHRDKRGGFFTLMLLPPADLAALQRSPVEMFLVIDRSGSTEGWPIAIEKKAAERALRVLAPDDTFQVISFADDTTRFASGPVPATPENVRRGVEYVGTIRSGGGTMMLDALRTSLRHPADPYRQRILAFMTDGLIGNENDMMAEVHQHLGGARIFGFGIGSSPNRYLVERLAQLGRGAVAYVGSNDTWDGAVEQFYTRISHPALSGISIDWGGMKVSDVYPKEIPDLFVGRPVIVTGRFEGLGLGAATVNGRVGTQPRQFAVPVNALNPSASHPGIAAVWARKRIAELSNLEAWSPDPYLSGRIKDVALEFGLMSSYTSFVAVDTLTRTQGDHGVTVTVPVPVPDGVRYNTTVQE